jgi:hypothetical protein
VQQLNHHRDQEQSIEYEHAEAVIGNRSAHPTPPRQRTGVKQAAHRDVQECFDYVQVEALSRNA